MSDAVTVVAGNGPSLAMIEPGRILASDAIWRVNNFYFEPQYFLGTRVDMAVVGGDPRVAPFALSTLAQAHANQSYDVRAWSSPDDRVLRHRRRAAKLRLRTAPDLPQAICTLQRQHGARITTGIAALVMAYAWGARRIVLAGFDLYGGPQRYVYPPGRHQRALLGRKLAQRGYDAQLHSEGLDLAALAWVNAQPGVTLWRACQGTPLDDLLELAPIRAGAQPAMPPKPAITDWVARAGAYPIGVLKGLRWLRRKTRAADAGPSA